MQVGFLYYIRQDKIPVRQRKAAEMVRISDIIRAEFAEGDDRRDTGLTTPEDIQRYDNIFYGTELD